MSSTKNKTTQKVPAPVVAAPTAPTAALPSPELRTPPEIMEFMANVAVKRVNRHISAMFLVGLLAGLIIGIACIATFSVTYLHENANTAKVITSLLFPFGLVTIVFSGAELFTGNVLIIIGVLEKKVTLGKMAWSWLWVYLGNFVGSMLAVYSFGTTYLLQSGNGQLAVAMMKTASTKVTISMYDAIVLSIMCNILVTLGILFASGARDAIGKVFGGLIPVSLFVMSGFEHCVANMFYIPIGILAAQNPVLASLALEAGVNITPLTVENFFMVNLLPVTLGNTIGGLLLGSLMWYCHKSKGGEFYDGKRSTTTT